MDQIDEFMIVVMEMRQAQKEFFKSKRGTGLSQVWLEKAQGLEKKVDTMIHNKMNPKLF